MPGARWVSPENLHLTLRFIGEVHNGQAQDIDSTLMKVRAPKLEIQLDGVGLFGKAGAARILWAGVRKSEALTRLHGKVESALRDAGISPDERKFSPHVTLARLRNAPASRVQRFVAENAHFATESLPVDHFVLYSSHRSTSGAIYTAEADYALGA